VPSGEDTVGIPVHSLFFDTETIRGVTVVVVDFYNLMVLQNESTTLDVVNPQAR